MSDRVTESLISDDFGQRIARGVKAAIGRESVHGFAKRAGIRNSTLRSILNGAVPGVDKLVLISRAAGTTIDALVSAAIDDPAVAEPGPDYGARDEFLYLPKLAFDELRSEQIVDRVAFRRTFILGLGIAPTQAALVVVAGDAMWPTLSAGDAVLIDRGATRIQQAQPGHRPRIYAFAERASEDRLSVARLHAAADGDHWCVAHDNDAYGPARVEPRAIRVIGRVRWAGGVVSD